MKGRSIGHTKLPSDTIVYVIVNPKQGTNTNKEEHIYSSHKYE